MTIKISSKEAIKKLIAFINANAKGRFEISAELVDDVHIALQRLVDSGNFQVTLIQPNGQKKRIFAAGGFVSGGAAGYFLGSLPGAVVGAGIGLSAGLAVAHIKVEIAGPPSDGKVLWTLA
jgi:hypothetical protein